MIRQNPLHVYALLELGIAACGILVLVCMPLIDRVYIAAVGNGLPGMLLRGWISAICLLPPTILMGASLPAIVRWVESTPRGVSWWGLLYGGNTLGAVAGCLLAGFYLLRIYDIAVATFAAVAINVVVALVSFALARVPVPATIEGEALAADSGAGPEGAMAGGMAGNNDDGPLWPIYVTIGVSGACALGAEVIWTRLMGMLMGATVYVFSIILAVFLIGLALGSSAGSWLLRVMPGARNARLALG